MYSEWMQIKKKMPKFSYYCHPIHPTPQKSIFICTLSKVKKKPGKPDYNVSPTSPSLSWRTGTLRSYLPPPLFSGLCWRQVHRDISEGIFLVFPMASKVSLTCSMLTSWKIWSFLQHTSQGFQEWPCGILKELDPKRPVGLESWPQWLKKHTRYMCMHTQNPNRMEK